MFDVYKNNSSRPDLKKFVVLFVVVSVIWFLLLGVISKIFIQSMNAIITLNIVKDGAFIAASLFYVYFLTKKFREEEKKLKIKIDYDNLIILDGYNGGGYKNVWQESVELSKRFFRETTILTDQVYTGKAFYAYRDNFIRNQKSSKIIFLHTGGLFGVFPKRRCFL